MEINTTSESTIMSSMEQPEVTNLTLYQRYNLDPNKEIIRLDSLSPEEMDNIVNVTREYPSEYATVVFGYAMPVVLLFSMVTNTLLIMVLNTNTFTGPVNQILLTLAKVDILTVAFPAPWYFYLYTLGFRNKFLHPPMACYIHYLMTDVIPVLFHTASIWLTLFLAFHRFLVVCIPGVRTRLTETSGCVVAVRRILWLSFGHQFLRFFDNTFVSVYVEHDGIFESACKIGISDWVHSLVGVPVYYSVYFLLRILFVSVIPCVVLLVINCLLFRALRRAEVRLSKLTGFQKAKNSIVGSKKRDSQVDNSSKVTEREFSTTDIRAHLVGGLAQTIGSSFSRKLDRKQKASERQGERVAMSTSHNSYDLRSSASPGESTGQSREKKVEERSGSIFSLKLSRDKASKKKTITGNQLAGRSTTCLNHQCHASSHTIQNERDLSRSECTDVQGSNREKNRPSAIVCNTSTSHQPVSQCSSSGGNTNQATNEDISSGRATQHSQSACNEEVEGEPSVCFGDQETIIDEENLSLHQNQHESGPQKAKAGDGKGEIACLDKSNSFESRHKCSCQSTPTSLARNFWPLNADRCSCTSSGCMDQDSSHFRTKPTERHILSHDYSKSETCMNCYKDDLDQSFKSTYGHKNDDIEEDVQQEPTHESEALEKDVDKTVATVGAQERVGQTTNSANTTSTTINTTSNKSQTSEKISSRQSVSKPSFSQPAVSSSGNQSGPSANSRAATFSGANPTVVISRVATNAVEARIRDNNRTTAMLIVMVTMFLMIEVPVAVVTIFHVVSNTYDVFHDEEFTNKLKSVKLFINSCIILSYSLNFFIYCVMSARFRQTLTHVAPFTKMILGEVQTERQAQGSRASMMNTGLISNSKPAESTNSARVGLIKGGAPQVAKFDEEPSECAL